MKCFTMKESNKKNINTWKYDNKTMENNKAEYIKRIRTFSTQSPLKAHFLFIYIYNFN